MNAIVTLLHKLRRDRFYGSLTLVFRNGRIELVRQEQSFKIDDEPATTPAALSGENPERRVK